jgi:hypothetical protein
MENDDLMTLDQAHLRFAKTLNGRTWELLGKPERTKREDELMVMAASASLYHWLQVGTAVHNQRGEWLLARVYTVLGKADPAMEHALRCRDLTDEHRAEMKDFDLFYADEAMARVLAMRGETAKAAEIKTRAAAQAERIADAENKDIVMGDLKAGPWFEVE